MNAVTRGVFIALLVVLTISLGGNYFVTQKWLQAREEKTQAEEREKNAADAARSCGQGVKRVLEAGDAANLQNVELRKAAAKARAANNKKADDILSTPASVPGDQCKSANDRFDNWLKNR